VARLSLWIQALGSACVLVAVVALLAGAFELSTPLRAGFSVLCFFYLSSQITQLRNARRIAGLLTEVSKIGTKSFEGNHAGAGPEEAGQWSDVGAKLDQLGVAIGHVDSGVVSSMEKADRGSAQRQLILKSMAEGLLAIDTDEQVVLVNRAAIRTLSLPDVNHRGRALENVTSRTEVLEIMRKCLLDGLGATVRIELPYADGSNSRTLELRAAPLKTERATQLAGCVLVIEDRTELERLERVRRDFVSNVSHELKTPLTSVRGYLETVLDDPELAPELRQRFLQKANNNAERLSAIVGDLISLARAESEEGDAARATVDLGSVARDVVQEATATAEAKQIQLTLNLQQPCHLLGDKGALQTALLNLVNNAIHYSPSGTEVAVVLKRSGDLGTLFVEDQGQGIPAVHLPRIFERFYRVDKDRSRGLGGTGLGLSIVRNVAAAHGGTAGVESEVGVGSKFWLELPLLR
jgi:two-component system phosphate regulon sensor histidine kinase PhoR